MTGKNITAAAEYKQYISNMLKDIHSTRLLRLIYRFVQSIYIHD